MSSFKEASQGADWEAEHDFYAATKIAREREDFDRQQEYQARSGSHRDKLVDLYDRKSHLENDLKSVTDAISIQEQQQEILHRDYDYQLKQLAVRRQQEDQQHQEWFAQHRDGSVNGSATRSKTNGRRASNRDMGNQQPAGAAVGGWTSINGARGRKSTQRDDDEELPTDPGNLLASGYQPIDDMEVNGNGSSRYPNHRSRPGTAHNGHEMDVDGLDPTLPVRTRKHDEQRPLKPKQRHSLPGFPVDARPPSRPKQETPIESKGRSPAGRRSLPAARSHAPQLDGPLAAIEQQPINQQTLLLKHNDKVYTEPPMYQGVPLERISPDHPYWDAEWVPLEDHIQPQLEKWQEKLDALRQDKQAVRHTVFLANRQVNRGQAIIDFLKDGDFHPYQYVGKEMMAKFYKTFINYDTMFRLVNVHEELKKFDLDVTPLEWLRQRMYEVSNFQGEKFSLSKYTHDLYHDGKLKALREKHGFGNIGRPSGYKVGEKNPEKGKAKLKRESSRRRARRSISQIDIEDPAVDMFMPGPRPQQPQEYLEPVTPRLQKRQRLETAPPSGSIPGPGPAPASALAPAPAPVPFIKPEPEVDDLDHDGYTSTDSFSAGRIMHLDWRVYQIKTSQLTTSTEVTQYWTWRSEKNTFEHQVLRDVHPKVTWGYYQKPINFDLKLEEIAEIHWSPDPECQKILIFIKGSTNVLAYFKRERTKKRFLSFIRKRGVTLVKATHAQIESAWTNMKSDTLHGEEEDM